MEYVPAWLESSRYSRVEREVFIRLVEERLNGRKPTRRVQRVNKVTQQRRRDEEWERLHQLMLRYERGRKV